MTLTSRLQASEITSSLWVYRSYLILDGSPNSRPERERIFRIGWVKILCQLTYQGDVLHHWVWGMEDGDRRGEIQSVGHRSPEGWHEKARSHTHLIYLYQHTPALIFPLNPSTAFSLPRFISHSVNCFVLFTDFIFSYCYFKFHMVLTIRLTQVAYGVCCCLCANTTKVHTEYWALGMCLYFSVSLWGENVVGKEWLGDWVTGEQREASQVHYQLAEWSTPGHGGSR